MLAVTLHGANSRGIPPEWPESIRNINNAGEAGPGEIAMTDEDYRVYKELHLPAYLAWRASLNNIENKRQIIEKISQLTKQKIMEFINEGEYWELRNFYIVFRYIELLERRINGNTLTPGQQDEVAEFRAYWNKIKDIQKYGDQLIKDTKNGIIVDIESGWPS